MDDTRGFSDARVVSDPQVRRHRPERHAAELAHHACITYRRPVDSNAPDNLHRQVGDGRARDDVNLGSSAALPE